MIIGYFGNVRQGKTLSAVRELYKFYLRGFNIYSNTHLTFPYKPLDLDYILRIAEEGLDIPDNSIFFIDEIYILMDSRISGSKRNRIASYFMLQTGKLGKNTDYGLILLFTCQYPDQIDKRLRHVMDIGVDCEKYIFKETKYFVQTKYVYKGTKSFSSKNYFIGNTRLYNLYDTRKRIIVEKDKYNEE